MSAHCQPWNGTGIDGWVVSTATVIAEITTL